MEEKKKYWEYWREIKADKTASRLTRLSFDMTIATLYGMKYLQDKREQAVADMPRILQLFSVLSPISWLMQLI